MAHQPPSPITVDVILRTHNRAHLLPAAIASFFAADTRGVEARLLVVNNASTDDTAQVLARLAAAHGPRLVRLHEPRAGAQHALNRALRHASAEIVACFDDDERIVPGWLRTIAREFANPATDYIGGAVLPPEDATLPDWLPGGFGGVLGIIDYGARRRRYGPDFGAMLTQGNCAMRRRLIDELGPYPAELHTAEDRWFDQRLRAAGKTGYYCPDFRVTHLLPADRLTFGYFRVWAAREGRDRARCDALSGTRPLTRRRWFWRQVAEGAWRVLRAQGSQAERLRDELNLRVAYHYARTRWHRPVLAITAA